MVRVPIIWQFPDYAHLSVQFAVHDRQYQAQNNPPCTISEIEAIVEAALAAATPRTAHEEPPRLRSTSNDLPFFIPVDLLIGGVLQGAAVGSGSNNDVWKGVWLGMINVALTRCWDSRFVVEDKGAITASHLPNYTYCLSLTFLSVISASFAGWRHGERWITLTS